MNVNSVTVRDFRSYREFSVSFDKGINVICGKNGIGKTNLLEGIFLFAGGKSFRGAKDREMIRFGADCGNVKLCFENPENKNILEAKLYKNQKREIFKNSFRVTKLSEYLGLFRAVVFAPDHMELIKGAPENRRRFLDIAMCQSFPRYVALLSEYNKTLIQKSACLKSEHPDMLLIDIYNEKLASVGSVITKNRLAFVSRLDKAAAEIYSDMTSGSEKMKLEFFSQAGGFDTAEQLKKNYMMLFDSKKETEITRKCCLYGAQRDDFSVHIKDKNARFYASQGQQRSAVLSLKLAEGKLSEEYTGDSCVYLLDDILSELDKYRQSFILERLEGRQFIITCCEGMEKVNGRVIRLDSVLSEE